MEVSWFFLTFVIMEQTLHFLSLGSSSSGNCYYLYSDTDGVMIDVGIGVRSLKKYFIQYGLSLSKVHHLLITHDHADHIKSVGSLSTDYKLDVYTTQNVHAGIDRNYCVRRKIAAEHKRYITPGEPFTIGEFKVTAFRVPHDSTDNVGYKIEWGDLVFALMTDVGHVTDEMKAVISEADYLVLEANHDEEMLANGHYPEHLKRRITCGTGHLNNRLCAETLANTASEKLKHVWLCHLSEENNHPDLALKTVTQTLEESGTFARFPFGVTVLKRLSPTGVFDLSI